MSGENGKLTHAAMKFGDHLIMMGFPGPKYKNPKKLGEATQILYVNVNDADEHFARAKKAGAKILEEPEDTFYGHRRYGAEDPEGHQWYFFHEIKASNRNKRRYTESAAKYKPNEIFILFLAEAPPDSIDRYFFFENVARDDWLWIALMKALYPLEWTRTKQERRRKEYWLTKFHKNGYWLIDSLNQPINSNLSPTTKVALIRARAPQLITAIEAISPKEIVLIKHTVHQALFDELRKAGLPAINERVLPFPCSGHQREFGDEFRELVESGKLQLDQG